MVDVTVVNAQARRFLDKFEGVPDVELDLPEFLYNTWRVIVMTENDILGEIVLDADGNVEEDISYPNWS